jgi:hypothetical protein
MNRITGRDKDGCLTVHGDRAMGCINDTIYNALAWLEEYEETGLTPEETHKLAKAQEEGRLVELPCKVGDDVYFIKCFFSFYSEPERQSIRKIEIDCTGMTIRTETRSFRDCNIGKTAFLSCEEAEAELKKQEANNGD